jgi:two-component system nitrogen regulation sensor histidine kinase NtrY
VRSLRSRLILGVSLVAVVPLALTTVLLVGRIEAMVRTQAAGRLGAALGSLQVEVASDGDRVAEKLAILARDPQLKRLYLLKPMGSRDLSEYLTERRFLLGLDFLSVRDPSGARIGEASAAGAEPAEPGVPEPTEHGPALERLAGGAGLALAASAPIRYRDETAGLVHGGLVFDTAFLTRLGRSSGIELLLRDAEGQVLATTLGAAPAAPLPDRTEVDRVRAGGRSYLCETFPLAFGGAPLATITGLVPTDPVDRAVASLEIAAALLGALGLGIAVLLGIAWSSQVSRPVEELARYSHRLAQGRWDQPLELHSVRELEALVSALDRMRRDLVAYRDRLIVSERQAAWSDMARKVAHEIKNPLTPIAVSVADLRRSFEQQRADFPRILDQAVRTVGDEVETLKRLLSEFSDFARFPAPKPEPLGLSRLLADLETLYGGDIARGRLLVTRPEREISLVADPGQLRQALVNLVQNGLEAVGPDGRVSVSAEVRDGAIRITVADTGPGLTEEQRARLFTPGFTTKRAGSGLGLTIVERIVNDHGGSVTAESQPGRGTAFRIRLPLPPES